MRPPRSISSERNRKSEVRIFPDALDPPGERELAGDRVPPTGSPTSLPPALAGHRLEQHLRLIVLGGLWPLVDVLVRGEPRALRCSVLDGDALVALELAEPDPDPDDPSALVLRPLATEVQQQLAVMRYEGARPNPQQSFAWREVLLAAGQRSDRGRRLLEWLRLGTPDARCHCCDAAATGLRDCRFGPERGWVLACSVHRSRPQHWHLGALELHLAGVPSCPSLGEQLQLEEVGHG